MLSSFELRELVVVTEIVEVLVLDESINGGRVLEFFKSFDFVLLNIVEGGEEVIVDLKGLLLELGLPELSIEISDVNLGFLDSVFMNEGLSGDHEPMALPGESSVEGEDADHGGFVGDL